MDTLADYLEAKRRLIEPALDRFLPSETEEPRLIHGCMRYSSLEGKRLRPVLTLAVAEMLGCGPELVLPTCAAVEFIHTHSLILDDLPCMDDDDYRRGRPSCHRQFGEGVALLAADALLNLAVSVLGANHRLAGIRPETALEIIHEVGEAVGTDGLIGGQLADLTFPEGSADATLLERVHLAKTARLFRLSARAGALIAEATPGQMASLSRHAERLGLAFQIVDDLLDRAEKNNPPAGGKRSRPSYVALFGIEGARSRACRATEEALEALSPFGREADMLRQLARHNLTRAS